MIAAETLDRVKRDVNIVEVVGESVKLTKRGRSYVGLCPFHKEKTPSFHVNPERGFYHCFGCHASGDAIKFLKETEGLDFVEAIRRLAERMGIDVVETASDAERREQTEARRRQQELFEIGNQAAAWFERMLREHPLRDFAEQELARRELVAKEPTDPIADALQAFRVGYAPHAWDGFTSYLREAGLSVAAAEKVGLVLPRRSGSGYYDRFRHRLMFAVLDVQGRVIAFSGRALDEPPADRLRALGAEPSTNSEPPAKYMNSPESPVYKKREAVFGLYQARTAIRSRDAAVLVEGNFDVLSLHARNLKHVVAPLGTAFTAEQARAIRRLSQNVILLFDPDGAGRRAVRSAHEVCREAGLTARVATLPDGVDPDEFSRRSGTEQLERVIDAAQPVIFHLIGEVLDDTFARNDDATKARVVKELIQLISSIEDPNERRFANGFAGERLAKRLNLRDAEGRTLQELMARMSAATTSAPTSPPVPGVAPPHRARSRDRGAEIEFEVLGAFIDFPEFFDDPDVARVAELLEGDPAVTLAALRQNRLSGVRDPEQLLAKLPPPIHPFALARWAAPKHERLVDAKAELVGNLRKLESLEWSREKSLVVEELERAEKTGDYEQQAALLKRLHERTRRARERDGS